MGRHRPAAAAAVLVAAAIAASLSLASPSDARAASGIRYGITDDAWLQSGSGSVTSRIARLHALGVQVVRFTLNWNKIAAGRPATPDDPEDAAYDWSTVDPVLDGLHAAGITVVLQLNGTPSWANGGKAPNVAPSSAASMRAFATAAATRYSWVTRWLIWNEPNQARWLRPASPAVYTTRLLNPAYTAIHATITGAQVAGGGTAPRGSTGGVSPVAWLTGMRAAHARLDAYAHNPYPLDPKRETPRTGGCTHCSTITMATISRLVALVARNFPRARIWLTEYGYQTNPPDRLLGVTPALQARYEGEGSYVAWRTPRVDFLIHFLYRDEPSLARFQSGLVTLGGKAKPALAAYELPLAEVARTGSRTSLWGQLRAPGTGTTARIERRTGATWREVGTVRAGAGRVFRFTGTIPKGSQIRVRAGSLTGAPLTIA
jgi:hypothetical protein